jgi:protein-tyrosine kinase
MSLVEKALKKMQDSRAAGLPAAGATGLPVVAATGARVSNETAAESEGRRLAEPKASTARSDTRKVVTVNQDALRAAGLLPVKDEERRVASQYRSIKRPLIAAALGRGTSAIENGRIIMVSSALPGEGKTFSSVNLAFNMALEKDTSVLLVDADLPKPQISRVFGVDKNPGLVDVLRDENPDVESVICPTNVRGLSILPAGQPDSTATELLASSRMANLVANLVHSNPRRMVLFDSSPLLLTTESRALAAVVGQIVIVVRAESTTQQTVLDALASLPEGKSVGLVLNHCSVPPAHEYYGYGDYGDSQRELPAD